MISSAPVPSGSRAGWSDLSDEQRLLLESVCALARSRDFRGATAEADREHAFPWPIWEALCDSGLPGLDVPVEYGGQGGGCHDVAVTFEVLAEHSIAATTALFTFAGFGAHLVSRLDASHPLRQLLPGLAIGRVRAALGLTEPAGGSALARMQTTLSSESGTYRLRGSKVFTTLAQEATHIVFGCLVPGDSPWRERFALAVVPPETPGLVISPLEIDSLRSCPTYEVFLDDVEVADGYVVEPPDAFQVLMDVLNQERIGVASQSLGLARRALQLAMAHVDQREVAAGLLADQQVVGHRLVDCWEDLESARLLVFRAAQAVDCGERSGVLPTMAQRSAAATAYAAADLAVQLHGGGGLERGTELNRLWRDTRLHLIGPVAREEAADYLFRHMRRSFS
jgi:alkylation response protein AidB-like acyl-CoA dehydrogenase